MSEVLGESQGAGANGGARTFQSDATRIWRFAIPPSLCPGGTSDNSPTFQRWEAVPNVTLVPKGRLNLHTVSAVPSGLTAFCAQLPNVETLGYHQASLRDEAEILLALAFPVRSNFPSLQRARDFSRAHPARPCCGLDSPRPAFYARLRRPITDC